MSTESKYISLFHGDKRIKTIADFMDREYIYNITPQDFFEYNRSYIFTQMTAYDKAVWKATHKKYPTAADLTYDMTLPCPCNLKIKSSNVTIENAISITNLQVKENDFATFANDRIQAILKNEGYKVDDYSKRDPDCKVFGWFKTLHFMGLNKDQKNKVGNDVNEYADLSSYIISLSTMVGKNGGSFTLRLPIIEAGTELFTGKVGKKDVLRFNDEFFHKSSFSSVEKNYFNWLISSNDLLFISFEKLEMEGERKEYEDFDNFNASTKISGNVYDMIALVDDVRVMTNPETAEAYVEVTGRDLMKLLIEDGSFFWNYSTTSDPTTIFANQSQAGKQGDINDTDLSGEIYNDPINRIRQQSGEIDVFANGINMDIDFILKGVISRLANIEVVPSYVFDSWGIDRTKFTELKPVKK